MPARLSPDRERGLLIAGGVLDDEARTHALLKRLLARVGPQPRVTLLSADSSDERDADLAQTLVECGAGEVHRRGLASRSDGEQRALLDPVEHAQLILLLGEQPLRLSTLIGGTSLARALRRRNADGAAIAGFAAGAAVLCEHMLAHGHAGGTTPLSGGASLAPGLGLTNRVVIDQGGHSGDRLGRLLAALALNPFALGLGLDATTAAIIGPDNVLDVIGSGGVTVIDPAEMAESNVADLAPGAPIRITNLRLHALTGGARYDLDFRRSID